jgi:hypothetical protein
MGISMHGRAPTKRDSDKRIDINNPPSIAGFSSEFRTQESFPEQQNLWCYRTRRHPPQKATSQRRVIRARALLLLSHLITEPDRFSRIHGPCRSRARAHATRSRRAPRFLPGSKTKNGVTRSSGLVVVWIGRHHARPRRARSGRQERKMTRGQRASFTRVAWHALTWTSRFNCSRTVVSLLASPEVTAVFIIGPDSERTCLGVVLAQDTCCRWLPCHLADY